MYVSEILERVRDEVDDNISSRWDDDKLVRLYKSTISRVSNIVFLNRLDIGRAYSEVQIIPGIKRYSLPIDFMAPDVLSTRDGAEITHIPLVQLTRHSNDYECSVWTILLGEMVFAGTPATSQVLDFYYFPVIDLDGLNALTMGEFDSPWGGRLDSPIIEYLSIRCQNIDEMTVDSNVKLLAELELNILATQLMSDPYVTPCRGWM